jgi:FixJ family two-component response regulator
MDHTESVLFAINVDTGTRNCGLALAARLGIGFELFSSAGEFVNHFRPSLAGCLLADLQPKDMSGLELQDALAARSSTLPIIFLASAGDLATVVRAMKNGALTVIEVPFQPEELAEAVRCGLEANSVFRETVARQIEVRRRLESLTAQERQLLEMIIEGTPNKRITRVFGVSQRTVARLRARVYEKMCVESAFELARIIANSGVAPAIDGQVPFFLPGREVEANVSRDCGLGRLRETARQQGMLPPPHYQQGPRRLPSGELDDRCL